ncbi:hypothetical protein [Cerasicoccus fimbriatus]|uniref:hypothetical protein n=1 Tax=Cerasicoccus fimbriatus TaxID=3014554 RepID=UPI0022B3C5FB|nr:hypothetical protein [Cerasicoccus sp. TK19100]
MEFNTEVSEQNNPTGEQIIAGLDSIDGQSNSFAILALRDQVYVQTMGNPQEGFVLEYRNGSEEEHYQTNDSEIPLDRIKEVFLAFAEGDVGWFDTFAWEPMFAGQTGVQAVLDEEAPKKSGCMTAIIFLLVPLVSLAGYLTVCP